jgi:polyribonucleotide nucleotidyltransferase
MKMTMFNEIIKEIEWSGEKLQLKTGKVARQSDGAVMVTMGDMVILCTAVSAKEVKGDAKFFPLTIHYREMAFAAGKIPGGFMKKEGRASEREILVSRLIDRPIRPLFHPAFFNETQVICTVLSYDPKYCSDVLSMIGASAALAISGVPYMEIIAASKVGFIDGKYVLNPSYEDLQKSKLDLVVAGTNSSVMMVESEAHELSEEQMLGAVEFGHTNMQPVIKMIEELKKEVGKPAWQIPDLGIDGLINNIIKTSEEDIKSAFLIQDKLSRYTKLSEIFDSLKEKHLEEFGDLKLEIAFEEVKAKIVRSNILHKKIRIDGRSSTTIRSIECETGILPRAHGSALFTRGETQGLVSVTLGTSQDEQSFDSLDGDGSDRFMLQYIFPPYSVGEASPFRAPGRREVGHGKLAWRAINPVLPSRDEFPYAFRVVSEITESNGSSSMATVCGASMALMSSSVPLKRPVAGIAMGLIKEKENYIVLSDIMGDEDHLGDMDFKVAGTEDGITALQMDIKVTGINFEIMKIALNQAKDGRIHILSKMAEAITKHSEVLSDYAPQIVTIKINKDKIRDIIGPGGKIIKEICEISGAKIDISDDGTVNVSAVGREKIDIALGRISDITYEPEVGDVVNGKVVKILDSGAFVSISGSKDGYLHISEISHLRIAKVDDELEVGKEVKVQIIGFDKGKVKLSMKSLTVKPTTEKNENSSENTNDEKPQDKSQEEVLTVEVSAESSTKEKPVRRRSHNDSRNSTSERDTIEATKPVVLEKKFFN